MIILLGCNGSFQRWSKARRAKDLVDGIGMQSEFDEGYAVILPLRMSSFPK